MDLIQIIQEGREARDCDRPDYACPYWVLSSIDDHEPEIQAQIRGWMQGYRERDHEIFLTDQIRVEAASILVPLVYVTYGDRDDLKTLGQTIALCENQEGLPAETAFTQVEATQALSAEEKAVVMFWYTAMAMQHRRYSVLGWKRYRQLQQRNWQIDLEVLRTGKFSSVFHILT